MKKLARRLLFSICTLTFLAGLTAPPTAYAQIPAVPYTATGLMGFAMYTEFAATIQNQGIHYHYIGYQSPKPGSNGGFPIVGGTILGVGGYGTGELICTGDLQYSSGSLVMDLRNMHYSNTFAGVTMSAEVFLNGFYQGRQTTFTAQYNELSNVAPGLFQSDNSHITLDPAFQQVFVNYFQVPQLLSNPSFNHVGFVLFSLNVQAI